MLGSFSKGRNVRNATYKHRKIYEAMPRVGVQHSVACRLSHISVTI